jgi:hypothetical protein
MTKVVKGPFQVKSTPLPMDDTTQKVGAMRMSFEKKFDGALEATGIVSMLGLMNPALGSGAYVALERITGQLDGRAGSFCLQHSSTMDRNQPTQNIRVVPDSGTESLVGLSGSMTVDIIGGQHFYTFEYSLP